MTYPYDPQLALRYNPSQSLRSMIDAICGSAQKHMETGNPSKSSVERLKLAIDFLRRSLETFENTVEKLDKSLDQETYYAMHNSMNGAIMSAFNVGHVAVLSDDDSKAFEARINAAAVEGPIRAGKARGEQQAEEAAKWRLKFIDLANEYRAEKPKCNSSEIRKWILDRQNKPEFPGIRFPNLVQLKKFMEKSGPKGGKDYITRKK